MLIVDWWRAIIGMINTCLLVLRSLSTNNQHQFLISNPIIPIIVPSNARVCHCRLVTALPGTKVLLLSGAEEAEKYCSISIQQFPCDMINTDAGILGGPKPQTNSPPTRSTVSANLSLIINVILSRYQSTS